MRRPLKTGFRLMAVVAALALLRALSAPLGPTNSPYLSALADLSGAPVLAANHCPDKACPVGGPCFQSPGSFCAKSGGQCFSRGCQ